MMPELAYRHPGRGKAHRGEWFTACGLVIQVLHADYTGGLLMEPVPVDQMPPADLCKRCWPGRAS
jgi:hypothetical protein